jgi:hypothetical protein
MTMQARLGDPEILCDLGKGRLAFASHRDHVTTELGGECLRHDQLPSSEAHIFAGQESTKLGAVPE